MSRRYRFLPLLILPVLFLSLLPFAAFTLRPVQMLGRSMEPAIPSNSIFLIQTIFPTPSQGDIIVFQSDFLIDEFMVKRVIATGGQHVTVDYASNTVTVDGHILYEPYLKEPMEDTSANPYMTVLDITVPDGSVYVMGDNRNHSSDSRDQRLGTVELSAILGKVLFSG